MAFCRQQDQAELIVPLSRQALAILSELHKLTGEDQYVFPGERSAKRPMSDNAVLAALRSMGIPADVATGHGFRASFRTIGDEVLKLRVDLLETQLAHPSQRPERARLQPHGVLGRAQTHDAALERLLGPLEGRCERGSRRDREACVDGLPCYLRSTVTHVCALKAHCLTSDLTPRYCARSKPNRRGETLLLNQRVEARF